MVKVGNLKNGEKFVPLIDGNEEIIYGILKIRLDKMTKTYRLDDIQKKIYELKEEIGIRYTMQDIVKEVMELILNEFDNIIEFYENFENNLNIAEFSKYFEYDLDI